MVGVVWRSEGWIDPLASDWLLGLHVWHECVHDIHTHWRGRIVVLVDRTTPCILVAVHKHVQERLQWKMKVKNYLQGNFKW